MDQMGALGCADIGRMCVECRMVTTSIVLEAIYKATRGQVGRHGHITFSAKKRRKHFALLKSDIAFRHEPAAVKPQQNFLKVSCDINSTQQRHCI